MKTYRHYDPDQSYLLPPNLREWLPEGHLALFIGDVVDTLDLSAIREVYEAGDGRGQPPYHPGMMVKLLMYAYCTGKPSSRKIEKETWENVAYRVLSADQHPDHDSIAAFRERHLKALAGLFLQVLRLCQEAGLVKLGHVALDGTKVKANASKHKAMSYERMGEAEKRLQEEVEALLAHAAAVDKAEDELYGKGKTGDELPEELRNRKSRLKKIREAKAALEAQAKARAEEQAVEAKERLEERARQEAQSGKKFGGKPPKVEDTAQAQPEPKAQRNFTDPESRIMKDGTGFEQAYNAQAVVDAHAQVIVATAVTQETNDKRQLVAMMKEATLNVGKPQKASADAGYFSAEAVTDEALSGIVLYVPPERQKHGQTLQAEEASPGGSVSVADRMRQVLRTPEGKDTYRMRKAIVEPVFGQIKEARGFRRFSFRGLRKVSQEWNLVCLTHNLLKLFRSGWSPALVSTG